MKLQAYQKVGTIVNFVDVTATFAVSETEPPITETTTSNTTLSEINEPGLNVCTLKSVSQPVVAVGDTITYTTVVQIYRNSASNECSI